MSKCDSCEGRFPYVSIDHLHTDCSYFGTQEDMHWCNHNWSKYAGITVIGMESTPINCKECKLYTNRKEVKDEQK